jgi:hypothetical protein
MAGFSRTITTKRPAWAWPHPATAQPVRHIKDQRAADRYPQLPRPCVAHQSAQLRLLDEHQEIVSVIYLNDLPAEDAGLDALGIAIGLRPVEVKSANPLICGARPTGAAAAGRTSANAQSR